MKCRRPTCQREALVGHGLRCGYCKKHCHCKPDLRHRTIGDLVNK